MEGLWNIVDGFKRRNSHLGPILAIWMDEEDKVDLDLKKVEELRAMCWSVVMFLIVQVTKP